MCFHLLAKLGSSGGNSVVAEETISESSFKKKQSMKGKKDWNE
jgi:hypothetical protein